MEAGKIGLGYSYTSKTIASLIEHTLAECVHGHDAMDPPAAWRAMTKSVRNMGRDGLAATGISAVDVALWDLKAKLLDVPLALLLGRAREAVPIYGSGGFTTYSDDQLRGQLAGWVERDGCRWVKMKVGSDPDRDPHRIGCCQARDRRALACSLTPMAPIRSVRRSHWRKFSRKSRTSRWFEEPVSSDDLAGMHYVRQHLAVAHGVGGRGIWL